MQHWRVNSPKAKWRCILLAAIARALQALAAETGSTYATGDVRDQESLRAAVGAAGEQMDGLVYAVGTITLKSAASVTQDDVDTDFALNARGALFAFQAALPAMKKSGSGHQSFSFQQSQPGRALPCMPQSRWRKVQWKR